MSSLVIGLDFGTESVRAVLVDPASGQTRAEAVHRYADGVIDERLPESSVRLPPDWALQNPADWLSGIEQAVRTALDLSGAPPRSVGGIGIDFTSCTVLPAREDGLPLSEIAVHRRQPHAWPKLWKHHAAQPQADRVNDLAASRREPWLPRYGGRISSEWLLPKALQILEEDPAIYAAADRIVEGADWVVWRLTGTLARNACCAGYKALWHKRDGYPSEEFLTALDPRLADLYRGRVAGPVLPPGRRVGGLSAAWAQRLGLRPGIAVAAPIIDAHAAVLGGGVDGPQTLFMIMGTSTCHLLMAGREALAEGIAGVVEDGIMPGFFGYEAGQAAVGDIFRWFVQHGVSASFEQEAARRQQSVHAVLAERAALVTPGESGLLALDWWNGNRSTLMDADLSGLLIGATLSTRPEEIYRALVEATAFGSRLIIETFSQCDLPVDRIVTGGGLVQNDMLMQIYADVTGREIAVAGSSQPSALGAAILAHVAAGIDRDGPESLAVAVRQMAPPPARVFRPVPQHQEIYDRLFTEYRRLYDYFGRGGNPVMKELRQLRRKS
jgi:L-ribulokinase